MGANILLEGLGGKCEIQSYSVLGTARCSVLISDLVWQSVGEAEIPDYVRAYIVCIYECFHCSQVSMDWLRLGKAGQHFVHPGLEGGHVRSV